MSGEAGSNVRPINSLLEEDVSFDHTTIAGKNIIFLIVILSYYLQFVGIRMFHHWDSRLIKHCFSCNKLRGLLFIIKCDFLENY